MFEDLIKKEQEYIVAGLLVCYPELIACVKDDDFVCKETKIIFEKMKKMCSLGIEINPLSVFDGLNITSEVKQNIINKGCSVLKSSADMYINYIKDYSKRYFFMKKIYENRNSEDFLNIVQKFASEIQPLDFKEKKDPKIEILKTLEEKIKNNGMIDGISTGMPKLDDIINGFEKGCLYVVAARSGMGKSAFITSCCYDMNQKAGIISLEMTESQFLRRIVSIKTNIPYWKIVKGKTSDFEFNTIADNLRIINNLVIDERCGIDIFQMEQSIRNMKNKGCEIVFIDHLGLIQTSGNGNRAEELGKITAKMKELAKALDMPIVTLCQLNREVDKSADKIPSIENLRDSSRTEEDADVVLLLYRPSLYSDKKIDPTQIQRYDNEAKIIVAKQRSGSCGTVNAVFDKHLIKYSEL